MIYGCAAWGLRETPLEEQLKITKDLNLNHLELGIANAENDIPADADDNTVAEVKALYEKYGVEMFCGATGCDFTVSEDECYENVEKIKKVIDLCEKLGIRYLRIFAGFSHFEEIVGERWSRMINCLNKIAEYSSKTNVVPVIETHGGVDGYDDGVVHFRSTSAETDCVKKMLSELSERIEFVYDPANLYAVGYDPAEFYNIIKSRTAYAHFKDFAPLSSGHIHPAACGESDMDWKSIFKAMSGFDGTVFIEYENVEDVREGIERSINYLNKIEKELANE